MADYYTKFSVELPVSEELMETFVKPFIEGLDILEASEGGFASFTDNKTKPFAALPDAVQEAAHQFADAGDLYNNGRGFTVSLGKDDVWVYNEYEAGNVDQAVLFLQAVLAAEDALTPITPPRIVTLEWSNDCSKPRLDAYGGGVVVFTIDESHYMSTDLWAMQKRRELGYMLEGSA